MSGSTAEKQEKVSIAQSGRYLTFFLSREAYGVEIEYVTEIVRMQKISSIPGYSKYFKGLVNLRGNMVPVIDMHLWLKQEEVPYTNRACIIVVKLSAAQVGLIVDSVEEVVTIDSKDIVPLPDIQSDDQNRWLKGIGKSEGGVRLLLDGKKLFHP